MPNKEAIAFLRQRLYRIVAQYEFQAYLNERCTEVLRTDTLILLRNLNQGQRRAVKVGGCIIIIDLLFAFHSSDEVNCRTS